MATTVNMHEAKTNLSRLVEAVEAGAEAEVVIARNGKPVAKLVPINSRRRRPIGLYDGVYPDLSLEEFNKADADIALLFNEGASPFNEQKARKRSPAKRKS